MSAIVTIAKDLPDGQIAVPTAVPGHSGRPTEMWTCGEQLSALERRRAHESKGMESLTHRRVREVRRPDYIKMSSAPSELMAGSSAPHLRAYICPPPRAAARLAAQSVGACAGLREQFFLLFIDDFSIYDRNHMRAGTFGRYRGGYT